MTLTRLEVREREIELFNKDVGKEYRETMWEYKEKVKKAKKCSLPAEELKKVLMELKEELNLALEAQQQFYIKTMEEIEHDYAEENYNLDIKLRQTDDLTEMITLLEAGANPDVGTFVGNWTILMNAISWKQVNVVKILIEHGADINKLMTDVTMPGLLGCKHDKAANILTPLMYALVLLRDRPDDKDILEIVKLLQDKGAIGFASAEEFDNFYIGRMERLEKQRAE